MEIRIGMALTTNDRELHLTILSIVRIARNVLYVMYGINPVHVSLGNCLGSPHLNTVQSDVHNESFHLGPCGVDKLTPLPMPCLCTKNCLVSVKEPFKRYKGDD